MRATVAMCGNELLRAREATRMPGLVALDTVTPTSSVLWHSVEPDRVKPLVAEWAAERDLVACMCGSFAPQEPADDGLDRCPECGCH